MARLSQTLTSAEPSSYVGLPQSPTRGGRLQARELRGGAALCIAAAAAEGTSRIYQYHYIARGYENIIRDLKGLGVVVH